MHILAVSATGVITHSVWLSQHRERLFIRELHCDHGTRTGWKKCSHISETT